MPSAGIRKKKHPRLKHEREKNLSYARVDISRKKRCGIPEVIYCPGKTSEQIARIMKTLRSAKQNVLATRATPQQYAFVKKNVPSAVYHKQARAITLDSGKAGKRTGLVTVVCAGTSDIPVAEEAALTAERMGAVVKRIYDVGVAGIHRLMNHIGAIKKSRAVIVVAGMEGALPSIVGGLIDKPVIAVPTSVGYGTGAKGLSAILSMLNSCVAGITVVNIDNGFGAGVAAALINRTVKRR